MRILDAVATAGLLPFVPLSEEIAATLARKARGEVVAPERLSLSLPNGAVLLVMPVSDKELAVTKLITLNPANPGKGLPFIRGDVVVMRVDTGESLGILDGPEVTARRTAAASLLAAERLAPNPEGPLLVIGAGVQALSHAMAFTSGLGVEKVYISSRSRDRSEAFAGRLRAVGVDARSVERSEDVLDRVTLIVTATTSPEPVISESVVEMVRQDAFISAVGSSSPKQAEIPAGLVRHCRLFVDDLEAARSEAGDLILAGVDWSGVTPLESLSGRLEVSGPVLYKGVGHAALDLAAARLAFKEV